MPITVDAPDGSQVEFPDSMQPEEIEGVLSKQFPNKDKERKSLQDEMSKLRFQGFLGEQEQAALGAAENIARVAAIPATPILKLPRSEGTGVGAGLLNVGAGLAEGLSAPAYWMLPGSKPLQALTAGQIAGNIPQSTVNAVQTLTNPQATTAQKVEAGAAPVLEAGTAGLLSGAIRLPQRAAPESFPEVQDPREVARQATLPPKEPFAPAPKVEPEPVPKETPPVVPQGETPAEAPAVSEAMQEGVTAPPAEPAIKETTTEPQIEQQPSVTPEVTEPEPAQPPSKPAEDVAAAKIALQVAKVERTGGQRPAKEVKSELLKRVEDAMHGAPEESAYSEREHGFVQINIPGDGDFKVPNNLKTLSEIRQRVKAISTTAGTVPKGPKVSTPPEAFKLGDEEGNYTSQDVAKAESQQAKYLNALSGIKDSEPLERYFYDKNVNRDLGKDRLHPNIERLSRAISRVGSVTVGQAKGWLQARVSQAKRLAQAKPISEGPGAASPGDVPAAARQAEASFTPIDRPFGNVSSFSVALNNIRDAVSNIGTTIKGIAGESLPKTTKANREVGEAGVRYASSRIAAKPLSQTFAAKVLQGTDVNPIKFGAALVEDNLRSVRESLRQQATEALAKGDPNAANEFTAKADNVATIIGSKKSPFQTEEAYLDYLQEPNVKQAVKQHIQMWDEVVDPQFRAAMSIDPDVELPSRGQQTGARVNLRAVQPEDPASNPIRGNVGSNLTGTFKRKSPFGVKARGTGQIYDINYGNLIQNTFERQLEIANKNKFDNMLVQSGLAVIDKPGKQVTIGDRPAVGFPLSRKVLIFPKKGEPAQAISQARNIYVRSDLANEYEGAAGVGSKWRSNWFTQVSNVINRAALSGLTDATVHVSNQLTALLDRPTSGKLLTDSLLSATGRADALVTVARGIFKAFQDNREQISQLSEIGAMRPQDIHFGVFGRALQSTDRLTRLLLDDTFKRLVESGLVENTETARREYVNQIGQYNRRLQGKITRLFRDTGIGPFVTAGKTFNALGIRVATLNPGAKGSNAFAAAALRANVLSKWVGGSVLLGTLNYLMTSKKGGGLMGRPGTPVGNLDLGTNDKAGKQQSFPLFSVLGLGRGLRVTGAAGIINAKRLGLPNADAAESASRDIINAWSAPFAGPPVKFGAIAATGYSPAVDVGRTSRVVPPGDNQRLENTKEAIRQASPIVQSYIKYRQGKPMSEVLAGQIPRFTLNPGRTEKMVEKYPRIVSLAQGAAFIDDMIHEARRLPKEERHKFVNEQVLRLPANQREHAKREAIRRKVYTN